MARSVKGLHVILSGTVAVSWCRSIRAMVPVEVRTRSVRVNVSLDEGLLARMDAVATRLGTSRSALLAKGARLAIAAESGT